MSQQLHYIYRDVYAREIAAGAMPREAHMAASAALREAMNR